MLRSARKDVIIRIDRFLVVRAATRAREFNIYVYDER